MKAVEFCSNTLKSIKSFPAPVRYEIGHPLERVQNGLNPIDWRPMPTVGRGVREIRVNDTAQYRVLYSAKHKGTIYVLHAFQKKTRKTRRHDIERSRIALKKLLGRNSK